MSFDLSEIGTLATLVADDPKLQMEMWAEAVRSDARDENPLKDFIGTEGSGMPIVEKRDLTVNGGQKVYFSTHAPVRGRGVMGRVAERPRRHGEPEPEREARPVLPVRRRSRRPARAGVEVHVVQANHSTGSMSAPFSSCESRAPAAGCSGATTG